MVCGQLSGSVIMDLTNTLRAQLRSESRAAVSECWVYTAEHGIQEVTLPSAQTTLTVGGQQLRPWCLLDHTILGCALAILYSVEAPSRALRERVTQLARTRFADRPWYPRAQNAERSA
jgi:hypothetical protein